MTNINLIILDESREKKNVSYQDILKEVELFLLIKSDTQTDPYINMVIEYNNLYNLFELQKIAEYYSLNSNKTKCDLINNIIEYEKNPQHTIRVCKRKKLWAYMKEIKDDVFLSKFLTL